MTEAQRISQQNAEALSKGVSALLAEYGKKCVGEEGYLIGEMIREYNNGIVNAVYAAVRSSEDVLDAMVMFLESSHSVTLADHVKRDIKMYHEYMKK